MNTTSPLSNWFRQRLFGSAPDNPATQASAKARGELVDAIQPYTDLAIAPFKKLPKARADRVFDTVGEMMGPQTGIMAGKRALTAPLDKFDMAAKSEKTATPDQIWQGLHVGRGKDTQWRYEIDDSQAKLNMKADELNPIWETKGNGTFGHTYPEKRLGDVLYHPELFKAYPTLAEIKLSKETGGGLGSFRPGSIKLKSADDLSTLLHELQHGVQGIEGMARGNSFANPYSSIIRGLHTKIQEAPTMAEKVSINKLLVKVADMADRRLNAYPLYNKSAGEVEARSVSARMAYNKLRRMVRPPWLDEDVARQSQIPFGFRND